MYQNGEPTPLQELRHLEDFAASSEAALDNHCSLKVILFAYPDVKMAKNLITLPLFLGSETVCSISWAQ